MFGGEAAPLRKALQIGLIATALFASAATALSPHRLVVVVARPDDPRGAQQSAALKHDAAAMRERDVVVLSLTPEAARRGRPELGVPPHSAFEVLLIGKDGEVKLRRDRPVSASEIAALIDTMPMRREEMKR